MNEFQPPGFGKQAIATSLGSMIYYTPVPKNEELPPLIFLHNFGGGASAYEWSKVYPAFTNNYRVLAPDLIGWGESAHPVRNYHLSNSSYCSSVFPDSRFHYSPCDSTTGFISEIVASVSIWV